MKKTNKILSVLMALMMGFTVMTTPVLAESPSDQEPAEEPEVTETQETEEPEAPAEEIKEQEEKSEEPAETPEVTEEPEEVIQPEETPEVTEEPAETEEPEIVQEEQEEEEPAEVTTVTPDPVTFNGVTVTVSYPSDAFGGKNVTLVVGEAGNTEKAALEKLGDYKAVDISFVDENGAKVQPEEGKKVSVTLKAEGMENGAEAEAVHVKADGTVEILTTDTEVSNEVTKSVKIGETTKTVEVPAETETVTVKDYKTEKYTAYETKTKKINVPAKYGYRYILKYKKNGKRVKASVANPILKRAKKDKNGKPKVSSKKYKVAKEKYVVQKAYTKTVTEKVPVTKTRKVQSGTHQETKVIKEAYSYEVKEDVYTDVTFSDVESSFTADSFSVYALIVVDEDGAIDFDETFGENHITVKAPAGAFEKGTVMKIEGQDDPEVLKNALKVLDDNTYRFNAVDISFWKDGKEVEPSLPVKVTWTSTDIDAGNKLIHIKDDGTAELMDNAIVKNGKATFTAKSFSTYVTTRIDKIDLNSEPALSAIVFSPSTIDRPEEPMPSGKISETHPEIEGYTFKGAYIVQEGNVDEKDPVTYVGAFIYKELDADGNPDESSAVTRIYYRTESTEGNSDLIVQLANDTTIQLTYNTTPYTVTYNVVYEGETYTIGKDELPSELADLVVNGPDSVAENTEYLQAVKVELPRGYSATVRMSNESSNQAPALGEGSEPNYTGPVGGTAVTPDDYPFTIKGTYTISNVNSDLTVTVNVTKRNSYRFTAQPAFNLAYFRNRYRNVSPQTTFNFTGNSTTFSFTTDSYSGVTWAMDGLNINKQVILVPFVDSSTTTYTTTTLESGTIIKVTAQYLGGTYPNRRYTIEVSNCYENITITGGNLHNVTDKPEWVLQERENIAEFYYGTSGANPLVAGEPMTYDGWQNYYSNNAAWRAWRNGSIVFTPRSIRFKVADGYANPQIKYVTPEGTDDYTRVADVTLATTAANYYHLVTSEPDANGYYWFSLKGNSSSTYMGLLSVKAELARYGVSYSKGSVADATMPPFDEGGRYGDGTLQGYNVEDNDAIVVAKNAPVDNNDQYIFMYYTIDGGDGKHYAPSQKIPLSDIAKYGVLDSSSGEYVIPFVAHWEKKEQVEMVNVEAQIYLDDELTKTVNTSIPKGKSVYIDIDSETMHDFMTDYNWQLFYDEVGSTPFVEDIDKDTVVELRVYSKFYVYHSSTGTLELHTTKELETGEGDNRRIGKLDITKLTNSGYLYGGYYSDYLGAHEGNVASGPNLVKAAADDNNKNGTLKTGEINALHEGKAVVINKEGVLGTVYNPKDTAGHVGYWPKNKAFTTEETTMAVADNLDWYSERKDTDTECIATGGTGTSIKVARAGIYYLKEVPSTYLRPTHMTTYQKYDRHLRDFILLSTIDDENYETYGFVLGSNDYQTYEYMDETIVVEFGNNWEEETVSSDGTITVGVEEASTNKNKGGRVISKRIFHLKNDNEPGYNDILGTTSFKPFWVTYDGVTVTGAATRRVTVKDKDNDQWIKVDSVVVDGKEVKEISFLNLVNAIKAFVR